VSPSAGFVNARAVWHRARGQENQAAQALIVHQRGGVRMMRVVIGTNVVFSCLIKPDSVSGQVLRAWRVGGFRLVRSEFLIEMIGGVLARPKMQALVAWPPAVTVPSTPRQDTQSQIGAIDCFIVTSYDKHHVQAYPD
jgi:hypothetical protein